MTAEIDPIGTPAPLLMTKLDQPALVAGLVERPALVEQLINSALRLTLIAAPAGWGKSTAVAEWAASKNEDRPFAFVHLGPEDDDVTSFWRYVFASIGGVVSGVSDPAHDGAIRALGIDPTRTLIPKLINKLHDLDEPVVLVLEDYHTISNPKVHRSVRYLIDNAPRCLHIVISTRSDPQFSLAGYRGAGTICEVRVEQLAMSSQQTQQFLEQRFGIGLTAEDAALVCERTEGWPAGIQLAGLSLAHETDPTAFVASFAGDDRNIADYLATEVLRRQPSELRQFLLATSILDEFDADVCDYVLETNNSAAMLEQIERSHLFLVSLDSRRTRYRYHHLFRDWLRHEHKLALETEAIVDLHRRAAKWMMANDLPPRAIGHLIEAGELNQAAQLMSDVAVGQQTGEHPRLSDIPDELVRHHPALALLMVGPAFSSHEPEAALSWIDTAEGAIDNAKPEHVPMLTVAVDLYRAMVAFMAGNVDETIDRCRAVLAIYPPGTGTVAASAQSFLGAALFATSGPKTALPHLQQSAAEARRLSLSDVGITAQLAAAYAELECWEQAEATAAEALSLPVRPGPQFPFNAAAHYALAETYQQRGETERAIAQAEQGIKLALDWVEPGYHGWGLLVMSQLVRNGTRKRQLLAEAKQRIANSAGQQRLLHRIEAAEGRLNVPQPRTTKTGMVLEPLTSRELDVLRLMRGDLTLREIGAELFISHNTAKGYTKTIYQKLGVNSRQEAVATAISTDLI